VKIRKAFEKYGIPLAIDVSPADVHNTKGFVPVLREFAEEDFKGPERGRSRPGTRHHVLSDCPRPGRTVSLNRHLLGGRTVLRLAQPLTAEEQYFRTFEGTTHCVHRDRFHLPPHAALEAPGCPSNQRLTSENGYRRMTSSVALLSLTSLRR